MKKNLASKAKVMFVNKWIDLSTDGLFECNLVKSSLYSDFSLVIDIYDLDNQVHPEGHLGWWKFPIVELDEKIKGSLKLNKKNVSVSLGKRQPCDKWLNNNNMNFKRLVVNVVLRSNITNAIIYLDRIPAFKGASDYLIFQQKFSRDWQSPSYASAGYILPQHTTIRLVSRNIFLKDAVGTFCLEIYRALKQNNIPVELYAEEYELSLNDFIRKIDFIYDDVIPNDQLLFFMSTFDPSLNKLLDDPRNQKGPSHSKHVQKLFYRQLMDQDLLQDSLHETYTVDYGL